MKDNKKIYIINIGFISFMFVLLGNYIINPTLLGGKFNNFMALFLADISSGKFSMDIFTLSSIVLVLIGETLIISLVFYFITNKFFKGNT